MKKISHLFSLVLLLCVFCLPASAQQQTKNDEAIAGAMAAMDAFMVGFNRRDVTLWAASLNYPHVRFASGSVTVWQDAEEFSANPPFQRLVAPGWDHSHWLSREVSLVSPGKVHISTTFQRFNSANEIIGTYQSLYIITEVDGHWGTQARSSLAP
ncbi:MAG: hypothetical protein COC19_05265 [SAR86 cluster bacterium]|uniref:DUF4440 domain-containing protein n=1 Tax=SAR86 cluster bacterium TaxID=2030880 RepID=A0A2A4MLQ7_9GAMM|nr:MAG: hypothetical protein COC19_05265 [SAR86 cluster bacterium]